MLKTERLDVRLTPHQKSLIDQAAEIEGSTLAGFTVNAVMERAADAVRRHQSIVLSPDAWEAFTAALDENPPVPNRIERLLSEPSVLEQ